MGLVFTSSHIPIEVCINFLSARAIRLWFNIQGCIHSTNSTKIKKVNLFWSCLAVSFGLNTFGGRLERDVSGLGETSGLPINNELSKNLMMAIMKCDELGNVSTFGILVQIEQYSCLIFNQMAELNFLEKNRIGIFTMFCTNAIIEMNCGNAEMNDQRKYVNRSTSGWELG